MRKPTAEEKTRVLRLVEAEKGRKRAFCWVASFKGLGFWKEIEFLVVVAPVSNLRSGGVVKVEVLRVVLFKGLGFWEKDEKGFERMLLPVVVGTAAAVVELRPCRWDGVKIGVKPDVVLENIFLLFLRKREEEGRNFTVLLPSASAD